MDTTKAVKKLNEILSHEWTGFAQYCQQAFVVQGVWREVYSTMFQESADECVTHARLVGDKIVALGGVPTIERNKVHQTDNLEEMLKNSHQFEKDAVAHYAKALEICADDRPLVVLLEDLILEEQAGVDEIGKLLGQQAGEAAKGASQEKAG